MLGSIIKHITGRDPNENLVERALEFAKAAHEGQKRVSGEDYITHPIRTAQILKELHLDEKTIAAGLLHDVPDDTQRTLKDIEKEFGKEVAFLVDGVSKLGKLRYPKSGISVKPIEERIEEPVDLQAENLRKMFFAMAQDLRVVLIKLADRLHNMETLGSLPPERQKRIALETLEIFAPLANRLGIGDVKGKLEDLSFPYLYPKEYEWLMSKVKDKYGERERYIKKLKPAVQKILAKEGIKPIDIHSRAKHYWSLYQKLLRYDMSFDKMYDLVALRIIVNNIEDCYKVLGAIHRVWKPMPGLIKDYIAFPKPNNYRSVHTTCFCLDGKLTEFQIKTPEMHEKAERGIAAHWAYKEGINLKMQRRQFSWVAQLSNWQKNIANPQEYLEELKIDFFKNRIFVLTPKGDVMDLPEGACSIDFAYAVHSDIGNKCAGTKINGKMATLAQPLKNGDMVEIITEKNKKPSRNWLEFVKTAVARSRIREQLKKELGKEKIDRQEISKAPVKQEIIKIQPAMKEKINVFLAGQTGMQNYLAQCCSPQIQDNIKAYITKNRGASIHKDNCPSILRAEKKWPQKIIEASWQNNMKIRKI